MNPTASPAARKRPTASAAPGSGSSPSQITPSRSRTTAGRYTAPPGAGEAAEVEPETDECAALIRRTAGRGAGAPRSGGAWGWGPRRGGEAAEMEPETDECAALIRRTAGRGAGAPRSGGAWGWG